MSTEALSTKALSTKAILEKSRRTALIAALMLAASPLVLAPHVLTSEAQAQQSKAPANAKVYFVNLKNGDTVSSPVMVKFGLSGMGVAPAGLQGDATHNTGHHHLLINTELKGEALTSPLPADEKHVHFGKGQTEASVTLPPGTHTLQLVLGDWTHIPHDPPVMSERITITVK